MTRACQFGYAEVDQGGVAYLKGQSSGYSPGAIGILG
jgi:hypothetical protein